MNYYYLILITHLSRLEQVFLADYNGKLLYNFNPINSRIVENFDMELFTPILDLSVSYHSAPHMKKSIKYDEINDIGKLPLRNILEKKWT